MNKKIGLLGGSFNPVHYGHLILAQEAKEKFNLDQVYLIPNGNPPHKTPGNLLDGKLRLNMCQLAVQDSQGLGVLALEINNKSINYTVNTLEQLKQEQFENDELYFIVGADSILELKTWKNYKKIFKYTKFICAYRPNYDLIKLEEKIDDYSKKFNATIYLLNMSLVDISSTQIRQLINEGKSIQGLTPEPVINFIEENNLYKK